VGVYLDLRQDIARWVTLDAGARYDWHSVTGSQCIPQGGLSVHVTKQSDIKASVSKGFRSPTIREMYMFPPASTDLEPEKMMQYELSFTQRFAGKGEAGANVFYIDGDNLITTVRTGGRPRNVNSGDFRNCGIEVFGHYRFTPRWKVAANYSYLHQSNPMEGAPEHKLFVSAAYTHPRWGAMVSLQHINGLYLAAGEDAPQEQFTLLNIDLHYNVTLSKANAQSMTLFVKGENLLAQSYQTYAGYYMPRATVFGGVRANF
jgi:iron complex outermembrane receptor protein